MRDLQREREELYEGQAVEDVSAGVQREEDKHAGMRDLQRGSDVLYEQPARMAPPVGRR